MRAEAQHGQEIKSSQFRARKKTPWQTVYSHEPVGIYTPPTPYANINQNNNPKPIQKNPVTHPARAKIPR